MVLDILQIVNIKIMHWPQIVKLKWIIKCHHPDIELEFNEKNESHIITVDLDMDKRTIAFSLDDKFLGVVFDEVEDGEYRLAISITGRRNKTFEFIRWEKWG